MKDSLLNRARPPVFCPGCSHERIVKALDQALMQLDLKGEDIVLVTDIGCSGLFDVFFHAHAFHGLHGRALTYALGLKLARPKLKVIVTMGDGGLGIGGAHILSMCRKNPDITLLILNNFNFGMTGGQYSATTPQDGVTSSKFLNQLEMPMDICRIAEAAGAPFIGRCSAFEKDLSVKMAEAVTYSGFSVMDIWGTCPGRYAKGNTFGPREIASKIAAFPEYSGEQINNVREEYVNGYKRMCSNASSKKTITIENQHTPPQKEKCQILILGSAGQRVMTAGEILCLAGLSGGMHATQKNDYDITVLVGPSVSEVILWPDQVGYTGIDSPDIILVLSEDGVKRRKGIFAVLNEKSLVISVAGVEIPDCSAARLTVDLRKKKIGLKDWALALLAVLAHGNNCISMEMFETAVATKFSEVHLQNAKETVKKVLA